MFVLLIWLFSNSNAWTIKQIKSMNCNNDAIYHSQVFPVSVVNSDWLISVHVDLYKKNLRIKLMYSLRENVVISCVQ